MAKILVMGDLAPIGMGEEAIRNVDRDWFTKGLAPVWDRADFKVANLECPLIEKQTPPLKVGPSLGVVTSTAAALDTFSLLGLANNHILDHGPEGLSHTMRLLGESGIPYVGVGEDITKAGQPHIVEINDVRVGVLAWSHREFCIATDETAGAFPISLAKGLPILEKLSDECDFVILLYHGGPEHFPYPTPQQRERCRFLASRGADFIFCQHSHIVGAVEQAGTSTIFYGQGNFCFDLPKKKAFKPWCSGMMCELTLFKSGKSSYQIIPTVHSLEDRLGPSIADEEKASEILQSIEACSAVLADDDQYRRQWMNWSINNANEYLIRQLPLGRVGRKILKLFGIAKLLKTSDRMLWNVNRIECEAHSEAIVDGLLQMTKQNVQEERVN